jgi:hypothetical protein
VCAHKRKKNKKLITAVKKSIRYFENNSYLVARIRAFVKKGYRMDRIDEADVDPADGELDSEELITNRAREATYGSDFWKAQYKQSEVEVRRNSQ